MIVNWLFATNRKRTEKRAHPSETIDWGSFLGIGGSVAGVTVNEDNLLTSATVYACVRVLSQALASLPLLVYRRLPDGGKDRATNHPLYPLLHDAPNPEMSSYDFRQTLMGHALTWGNGYAQIEDNRAGVPMALWPLLPNRVKLRRPGATEPLVYDCYKADGTLDTTLPADHVVHIRGLSNNGIIGYSPVRLAMRTFGLDMALEEFGAAFFGNGARPSIIIKHPGKLSKDAIARLKQSFEDNWSGLENAHRVQVLEEGMAAESLGMPLDEVEFLGTRKFGRSVIAGWFGVPPHMIGDLDRATFSNVAEQQKSFYQDTLRPWCANWEGALRLKLAPGQDEIVIEHMFNDLMLSNPTERAAYHQTMTSIGLQTINEGRAAENMNPVAGGDVHLVPLNLTTLDRIGETDASAADESTQAAGEQNNVRNVDVILAPLLADLERRIWARVTNDVRLAGAKALRSGGPKGLQEWLEHIRRDWRRAAIDMCEPVERAAAAMGEDILAPTAKWIEHASEHAVRELTTGDAANGKVATQKQPAEAGVVDLAVLVAGAGHSGRNGRGDNHA